MDLNSVDNGIPYQMVHKLRTNHACFNRFIFMCNNEVNNHQLSIQEDIETCHLEIAQSLQVLHGCLQVAPFSAFIHFQCFTTANSRRRVLAAQQIKHKQKQCSHLFLQNVIIDIDDGLYVLHKVVLVRFKTTPYINPKATVFIIFN